LIPKIGLFFVWSFAAVASDTSYAKVLDEGARRANRKPDRPGQDLSTFHGRDFYTLLIG
jgi:hypothetical protein